MSILDPAERVAFLKRVMIREAKAHIDLSGRGVVMAFFGYSADFSVAMSFISVEDLRIGKDTYKPEKGMEALVDYLTPHLHCSDCTREELFKHIAFAQIALDMITIVFMSSSETGPIVSELHIALNEELARRSAVRPDPSVN